ncbi:allophanate hydrolase [Acrocarpospora phusangensis]|uniref:Allophanate hydrolase n=1 Tax=Acrocarpospora phusangensis TaxID=1070424 RepID=A0A919QBU0_9ACTN|nr:biotin-dependent carboxyltransferase family protein [Acrocarpospora phusangensis]GIH24523.1 allophanate hydrolase [Acrocarpospora phusangensis]
MIEVMEPGPYATVQDLGRPGYAHLGVPRSGAADAGSAALANRLVGNPKSAALIELTFGGAVLRFGQGGWIAITGACCPVRVRGRAVGMAGPVWVPAGGDVRIGMPTSGLRTYVAVRGGVAVEPVLGSRSTDSLSGLGPPPLQRGTVLPVGSTGEPLSVDLAPVAGFPPDPVVEVIRGPRDDWFTPEALDELCAEPYEVSSDSNRVGVRLTGRALTRSRQGELPSEGMVAGAVQVPPNGQPIVFLADHPPTGGYPVVGVVRATDLPAVAQCRPGTRIRFRLSETQEATGPLDLLAYHEWFWTNPISA